MISVVIPALNEELAIGATIAGVSDVLTAANLVPFEIVIVDDGSTDQTGKIAAAAGAKVVRHPHNIGYGRSLKNGIAAAQFDMAPPAVLCWKMTAGPGAVAAGAVGPKLRLFFSAVNPCATQLGAVLPP